MVVTIGIRFVSPFFRVYDYYTFRRASPDVCPQPCRLRRRRASPGGVWVLSYARSLAASGDDTCNCSCSCSPPAIAPTIAPAGAGFFSTRNVHLGHTRCKTSSMVWSITHLKTNLSRSTPDVVKLKAWCRAHPYKNKQSYRNGAFFHPCRKYARISSAPLSDFRAASSNTRPGRVLERALDAPRGPQQELPFHSQKGDQMGGGKMPNYSARARRRPVWHARGPDSCTLDPEPNLVIGARGDAVEDIWTTAGSVFSAIAYSEHHHGEARVAIVVRFREHDPLRTIPGDSATFTGFYCVGGR